MPPHAEPPAWASGPADPALAQGALHVWKAELDHVEQRLADAISRDERARADRLLGAREQQRWTSARAVLRALLALYLDLDPAALRFNAGPHGKPALDPPAISFNLSHSGSLALYAIARRQSVGVDVELDHHDRNSLAIAERVLGEQEAARLKALEPPLRRREFLRAWTRHEATTKCLGRPLLGSEALPEPPPWILDLDVPGAGAAAVAVDGPPPELSLWCWPPAAQARALP
ncbi:MAG: 4'-phosphopantetheinyl transferase family protein [Solirubrobacteraceae bacterium]